MGNVDMSDAVDSAINLTKVTVFSQIATARAETIAVLSELNEVSSETELPIAAELLNNVGQKLRDNSYNCLVVGEAKRGKSTFVNAVIGRDLLPTNVDIATSQVFRVKRGEREAYQVRFEDDSVRSIDVQELPRYGSQVYADNKDFPTLDEVVRWIEVDVPVKFLPPEIVLIDTPGLGSLYAAHAQITLRYVPQTDAVIFVLGSNHPISEPELAILAQLLEVTDQIFLIQTMIDQHRREDWEAIQRRNLEIIRKKMGDRLPLCSIWPVSSRNLRQASETGDDDYLRVSRFPELVTALQRFLFRASGWASIAKAVMLSNRLVVEGKQVLAVRRASLLEESAGRRQSLRDQASLARRDFEKEWGPAGQRRKNILQAVQRHVQIGRQAFQQFLHPVTGEIAQQFLGKIDALQSLEDAQKLALHLNDEVAEAAGQLWWQVCESAKRSITQELAPLIEVTLPFAADSSNGWTNELHGLPSITAIEAKYFDRIKNAMQGGAVMSNAMNLSLFVAALVFPVATPIVIGGTILVMAAGIIQGATNAMSIELRDSQAKLKAHLSNLLQHISQRFHAVDLVAGRFSIVEVYFQELIRSTTETMDSLAQQRQAQLQSELQRIDDQLRMTEQQRKECADRVEAQLQRLSSFAARLEIVSEQLNQIDLAIMSDLR